MTSRKIKDSTKFFERLTGRITDVTRQKKALYLSNLGFNQTDIINIGLDLFYEKEISNKPSSIPLLIESINNCTQPGKSPKDLSHNRKNYLEKTLDEKYTG